MDLRTFFSHNGRNPVKLVFILSLISLVLVEIIAYLNPQEGYEISFYSSTPPIIFILIGAAIVGGIYILFQQVLSGNYQRSKIWIGGFLLLLLTRMIILYLPYIRGYYTWMGDNSTHLGLIQEAVTKGYIDERNFYPITHIFLTQITLVTSLSADFVANHSTALLSILYVLGVFLLAKIAFDDEKPVILTIAAVGCVIFSGYELYLMPNGWSCLYLPLAIYLIVQSINIKNNFSFRVLALIAVVLYPFFHPFSTLLLLSLLILFILAIFTFTNTRISRRPIAARFDLDRYNLPSRLNMVTFLAGIGASIWILWLVSFKRFYGNIRHLADAIINSETVDVVGAMGEKAGKMDFNLMDIFILLIKDYGDELIFFATFFLGVFIFVRNRRRFSRADNLLLIALIPLALGLLFLLYLTGMVPGLDSINAVRVQPFIVLVVPIFSGLFFCHALSKKRSLVVGLCFVLLIIPPLLALFSVVPSPYVHRPTPDITEMDLKGMEWSFDYKDIDLPYVYIMSPPYRFADIILGRTERENRLDIDQIKIPDHFDYGEKRFLGESFGNNSYTVITKFDTILYETAYEKVGRFQSEDFDRLQSDPTVDRLYCNKESTVYLIRAAG